MATLRFGRRETDWLLIGIAASCAALAWVFVKVGAEVTQGSLSGVDANIRQFVVAHRSGAATAVFTAVSALGSNAVLLVLAALAGWKISERSKTVGLLIVLCGIVSSEFVDVIKAGMAVQRPPSIDQSSRSFSFPSGHVSGATAIATLLSYIAWRRRRYVLIVAPVSVALVVLMALSRIYLDQHWMSDTVGGALIGLLLGLCFCALYEFQRHHVREEP